MTRPKVNGIDLNLQIPCPPFSINFLWQTICELTFQRKTQFMLPHFTRRVYQARNVNLQAIKTIVAVKIEFIVKVEASHVKLYLL